MAKKPTKDEPFFDNVSDITWTDNNRIRYSSADGTVWGIATVFEWEDKTHRKRRIYEYKYNTSIGKITNQNYSTRSERKVLHIGGPRHGTIYSYFDDHTEGYIVARCNIDQRVYGGPGNIKWIYVYTADIPEWRPAEK